MKTLRELADARGVGFGCAVSLPALIADKGYRDAVGRECTVVVAENASKFGPLSPSEGVHNYSDFDKIVDFAEAHQMKVRGHTLVWHQQMPAWLSEGDRTNLDVREILESHITKTVGRYKGRIESWDVVNEAIDDEAQIRDTCWLRKLGQEYVEWAFRLAREADPEAQLVYNDYSIEEQNPKSDRVYGMVKSLLDREVPVHAVGLQAHLELANPVDLESVRRNIRRFRGLGLGVLVTEMDVRIPVPFSVAKREAQGKVYEDFVHAFFDEGVDRILTWGLTDRYSWIPGFFKGTGEALPLDNDLKPKPAYMALTNALSD